VTAYPRPALPACESKCTKVGCRHIPTQKPLTAAPPELTLIGLCVFSGFLHAPGCSNLPSGPMKSFNLDLFYS
jgi:hypothetical protein